MYTMEIPVTSSTPMNRGTKGIGNEDAQAIPAVSEGYHIWTVERKPVSVHLRDSIAAQIRHAANAPQEERAGLERGGILWGRVRDTGENYYLISIEYAECLACDHSRGEGWVPSDKDRRYLRKRLKDGYGDLQCVGYWRTHQRPGLYLDNRDLELMAAFFAKPWCVALCVRPPATAGFFVWENGEIHRTSSYREFELPDAGQPVEIPVPPAPQRDRWGYWAASGAVAVALMVAPFLVRSSGSTGSPFNMLSMRAETQPGILRLRWDPNSQVLNSADTAIIWIADGADESKLELTRDQIRSGMIDYRPASSDVNFRMEVGKFTESLRVAGLEPAGASTAGVSPAVESAPPELQAPTRTERARRKQMAAAAGSAQPRVLDLPQSGVVVVDKPREVEVPPPPMQVATEPPKLDRSPVPQRAPEMPKVMASIERPRSSPIKKVFGWIPGLNKKEYVPARVVRQVQPRVSANEDTQVSVRVAIDQKGVVRDADLLTKGVDGHLGRSAVEAARRWRFEPARDGDGPVASNMVVKFRFGPARN
jgi:TonB family protein